MTYVNIFWLKLIALFIYLFLLFIISRLIETASWNEGVFASRILDPLTLSVRKLKSLLDARGISYTGVLEIRELTQLVQTSGEVIEGELEEAEESEETSETHFSCGTHFYEEVEDTKDSIWLVQVLAPQKIHLLSPIQWNQLKKKVSHFGVRIGTFNCALDKRLCSRKSWYSSRLILALPRGHKAKDSVILHSYTGPAKTSAVFKWLSEHLAFKNKPIESKQELENVWLHYDSQLRHSEVRVVLVSNLLQPPTFLSALSVKFTGRIRFGYVHSKIYQEYVQEHTSQTPPKLNKFSPLILIITPEEILKYGINQGEHLNYKTMEFYLKTFKPEVNDIFICSLTFVNIIGFMELFLVSGILWRFAKTLWVLGKYNSALIICWLILLALFQFSFMKSISEIGLKLMRVISRTSWAACWRRDYHYYKSHSTLLLFPLLPIGFILNWLKLFIADDNSSETNVSSWWISFNFDVSSYFFRPSSQVINSRAQMDLDLEEGIEFLIERLAVPNFWLQPIIPDYLPNLPVWSYEGSSKESDNSSCDSSGSDGTVEIHTSCPKVNVCQLLNQKNYVCEMKQDHCSDDCKTTYSSKKLDTSEKNKTNDLCKNTKNLRADCLTSETKTSGVGSKKTKMPLGMHECHECVICLDAFVKETLLCGLPCGHFYHQYCIMKWLVMDNHICPICRWPAYKSKKDLFHLHSE